MWENFSNMHQSIYIYNIFKYFKNLIKSTNLKNINKFFCIFYNFIYITYNFRNIII